MDRTVKRHTTENGETYRLANRGYSLGYAIERKRGKNYVMEENLGWVPEAMAIAWFYLFVGDGDSEIDDGIKIKFPE